MAGRRARIVGKPQVVSSTIVLSVDVDGELVRIASWSSGDLHVVDHGHEARIIDAALEAARVYAQDERDLLRPIYEAIRRSTLRWSR
jgi:hypothetical protein